MLVVCLIQIHTVQLDFIVNMTILFFVYIQCTTFNTFGGILYCLLVKLEEAVFIKDKANSYKYILFLTLCDVPLIYCCIMKYQQTQDRENDSRIKFMAQWKS